ncbi:hypothetical protein SAMN05421820_101592 [Pedobacter steynii]|uniref:Uncharacterized protein n=1 Tax=Pedobacter steynii TaxID=430522 RepID=A0A1G9KIA8_9SPHI|nr:hypothetical protein SAMN05421820_101592 [Pedobacter steynii]
MQIKKNLENISFLINSLFFCLVFATILTFGKENRCQKNPFEFTIQRLLPFPEC